ncbi:MAG: YhcH/YjgK/YiaL family protein [Spirochaetales bacterium]|nr:YhcH/YjgK/YiaL family protein [Spirochaetales bacterium]MBR4426810.1 YhcH/YjgK/YiaL family protein [Spirochaetales bacterium]
MVFDTLDQLEMYIPVLPSIRLIADIMDHDDLYDMAPGSYKTKDSKVTYKILEYMTSAADRPFEYHKDHSDLMVVLSGQELMSTSWRELKNQSISYDQKTDTGYFNAEPISVLQASQGRFAIFFPGEPHKSGVAAGEPSPVKKVVFKIED